MNRINFFLTAALLPLCATTAAATDTHAEQQLLDTVHSFYGWVLQNGEATAKLQPRVSEVPGSNRLRLDASTLPAFTAKFMDSGYFAPGYPAAVTRYYAKQRSGLKSLTPEDLDKLARGGRGPMMETENMDIFFCAQEYEYTASYVQQMKIKSSKITGSKAIALVESSMGWETTFRFAKVKNSWRIAGYCVYE